MEDKIIKALKTSKEGLTITELVKNLNASRFIVRNNLSKLEWDKKVYFKKTGMAKVYFFGSKNE
jgi:transcriptional regulator of NAD metabolism